VHATCSFRLRWGETRGSGGIVVVKIDPALSRPRETSGKLHHRKNYEFDHNPLAEHFENIHSSLVAGAPGTTPGSTGPAVPPLLDANAMTTHPSSARCLVRLGAGMQRFGAVRLGAGMQRFGTVRLGAGMQPASTTRLGAGMHPAGATRLGAGMQPAATGRLTRTTAAPVTVPPCVADSGRVKLGAGMRRI
jgi:hypothetical protein